METLIEPVRIYSQNIGMEFGIEKCTMLIMKSGKRQMTEGIEIPNQENIITLAEKKTYKDLWILEADTIKHAEMKEKIEKEYIRRTRKLLETKPHSRNLIKGINTWVVLVRFSRPFLKWTREELQHREQEKSTMHKALHPRDDVDEKRKRQWSR